MFPFSRYSLVVFLGALWTPAPLAGETQSEHPVLTHAHGHWWMDHPPLFQRMSPRTNTAWSAEMTTTMTKKRCVSVFRDMFVSCLLKLFTTVQKFGCESEILQFVCILNFYDAKLN